MKRTRDAVNETYFVFRTYSGDHANGIFFTPTTELGDAIMYVLLTTDDPEIAGRIYRVLVEGNGSPLDSNDDGEDNGFGINPVCRELQAILPGLTRTTILGTVSEWKGKKDRRAGIPIEVECEY